MSNNSRELTLTPGEARELVINQLIESLQHDCTFYLNALTNACQTYGATSDAFDLHYNEQGYLTRKAVLQWVIDNLK